MKQLTCIFIIFIQVRISIVSGYGFYTIVAPGTIQSDYDYAVTVTVHDNDKPATIKVGISGPSYNESKTVEVNPFSAEVVHFDVPVIADGTYELQTEGLSGLIFKEHTELNYKCEKPKVYIQTDKAMYKPGDLVQYRILALNENARPAVLKEPLRFGITDGAMNQIKQIKDMKFTKGVHTGKFQLSEQPVLGSWSIDITAGKDNISKAKKTFEVAKYVLPKFSVELETDKKVAILDKVVKITVRSKYTYGKPVKGKATITARFKPQGGFYYRPPVVPFGHPDSPMVDNESIGAVKTLDIDGKGEVEFHLMDDLKMDHNRGRYLPQIEVEAVMTEAFTGLQQNTTTTIGVERSRYTITVPNLAHEYEVNKPFEIQAIIKKLNGLPVQDARSTAKLILSQGGAGGGFYGQRSFGFTDDSANDLIYESEVDKNGVATFKLKLTSQINYDSIKIMYEEKIQNMPGFKVNIPGTTTPNSLFGKPHFSPTENVGPLKLFPKTRDPKLGEDILIDIKSDDPIPYFVYTVIVRGKIIKHEYVKVAGDKKCHCLKIKPTFEMAPMAKIFVYLIRDNELKFDETTINIPNKFENKLEIIAPEQAKPSDLITLNIKTDPDSFVGLLGVDQSVLLLQSGNDLNETQIFRDLRDYDSSTTWNRRNNNMPGRNSGFVTLTNACYPRPPPVVYRAMAASFGSSQSGVFGAPGMSMAAYSSPSLEFAQESLAVDSISIQPKIRKDFVENWIFDDIESTDSNGIANFTKKIPDTITSWVITGFSMNENTGFGMTPEATKIRVFQPFFLSTNLPYSIKRGEVITIPIVVFNYMESTLDAEITMDNSDREYDFTEAFTDVIEIAFDDKKRTKKLSIPSNNGETVSFTIRPNIVGEITLKIKAITPVAGDAMHQKLKVEPEGVSQYQNEAFFVTVPEGETFKYTLKANIPADVVLDSEYIEFSAVGDILGPTIKNIDALVRMPYGCGEQNMVNFVPNILVLHYLNAIGADMPGIVDKAKNYMEKGYQRELTYKHKDGAYSAFGEGHSQSNSWLTAYVARSFIQARKFITIDENVIQNALEYLITTQKTSGQFPQTGKLFHSTNQNELGVSAFIMLSLLEDTDYALKYKKNIENGLQYLADNVESEDNVYTLALISLVFQKVKHPYGAKLWERLELASTNENNLKWWGKSSKYHNNNIEITAYILQSLVDSEEPGKLLPIIKWLIGQRNSLGGFDSTQDTVVGLQALIKFAEKYAAGGSGKMTIEFEAEDNDGAKTTTGSFDVDKDNSLLLQSHVLPKSTRQVTLTANGQGSSLVQLSYRYNIASEDDKPSFLIKRTVKQSLFPGQLSMNICVEYQPQTSSDENNNESNMAVMEIYLPSGYTTDHDSLNPIREVTQVQRVETKNSDTAIIVYFDSLVAGKPICFDVSAEKSHAVAKLKPAAITVYDYYDTEQRATVYYEVTSSLCDICGKDECGKGCRQL